MKPKPIETLEEYGVAVRESILDPGNVELTRCIEAYEHKKLREPFQVSGYSVRHGDETMFF